MTSAWEPSTVPLPPDEPAPSESPWDPSMTVPRVPEAPSPNGTDQWEYADPNANPSPYATQHAPAVATSSGLGTERYGFSGPTSSVTVERRRSVGVRGPSSQPLAVRHPTRYHLRLPKRPGCRTGRLRRSHRLLHHRTVRTHGHTPIRVPTPFPSRPSPASRSEPQPGGTRTRVSRRRRGFQTASIPGRESPSAPPPSADQWVYVDPSAYSNPYTEQPVYTSGPQAMPTVAPVEPVAPGAQYAPDPATQYAAGPPTSNGAGQPYIAPAAAYGAVAAPTGPPGYGPPPVGSYQDSSPAGYAPAPAPQPGYGAPPTPGYDPAPADPLLSSSYQPEEGELKIKERRSWKTWQVLIAVLLAAGFGMWLNGNAGTASGNPAASGTGGGGYKLPPDGASATTAPASAAAAGTGSTATTAAGSTATTAAGSTSTTAAGGTTATTAAPTVGPATVLIPQTTQTGNWTSPAFTIAGGTWNIGWAFQCTPAPTGGPSFQIFVVNSGAAPGSTPAVTSTAASGQSVSPETTAGSQQVIVQTTAACKWAVKVTGSSS